MGLKQKKNIGGYGKGLDEWQKRDKSYKREDLDSKFFV